MPFVNTPSHFCPFAKGSQGLVSIAPDVIGAIATAVKDPWEWMILLLGSRNSDGLDVLVDDLIVPPHRRSGSNVGFDRVVPPQNCVGVLHSHNSMTAFFSGRKGEPRDPSKMGMTLNGNDYADLNPLFPLSIVVSSRTTDEESSLLGFSYYAEGTFKLPCGKQGVCEFVMVPDGVEDWPFLSISQPEIRAAAQEKNDLADCPSWQEDKDNSNRFTYLRVGSCGLVEAEPKVRQAVFGQSNRKIVDQLPEPEKVRVIIRDHQKINDQPKDQPKPKEEPSVMDLSKEFW
ncbi:MAG: hypothetical protein L0Y56_01695, partial [Nitrospira sp.]|nr:hypothetical protein [Nitrospira sp.]